MGKCEQCIIKQCNALKSLSREELVRISSCKTSRFIKKGDLLFDEGDAINGIYCIRDGICKLTKLSANGKDQTIKMVMKGGLIGQRSLVSDESSNLRATALTDMKVCFIPKHEILFNLQINPKFALSLLKTMAYDLKEADGIIVDMAQKSVKQRLAETLIYISKKFDTNADGAASLNISREDYANIVGTATESVIRVLSQFKKQGLISTMGKYIKIEDMDGLRCVE
ncbi:Crp/Fnr family transcriptional regulator [Flavobacteriaceae bacterium MHTCC 0001]